MYFKIFSFKFYLTILVLFILSLTIESYINHYHFLFNGIIPLSSTYNVLEKYSNSHAKMDNIKHFIWEENGLVETLQVIILIYSIILYLFFLKKNHRLNFFLSKYLKILFFLGLIYYFLEEISWGQHLFNWQSPELFKFLNKQNETNLHNINNLFNQIPRGLILFWTALAFVIVKLRFLIKDKNLSIFLFPSNNLRYISFLVIFFTLPNILFEEYLDLAKIQEDNIYQTYYLTWRDEEAVLFFNKIKIFILNFINFKFLRISELEEFLFCNYFLIHSYYLKNHSKLLINN